MAAISSVLAATALVATAVSAAGAMQAGNAQAAAARANASFLMEQNEFARRAKMRELKVFKDEAQELYGAQLSGFSRAGVTVEGSPLLVLAQQRYREYQEENAIIHNGEMREREAFLKAGASLQTANAIRSSIPFTVAGSILGGATSAYSIYKT